MRRFGWHSWRRVRWYRAERFATVEVPVGGRRVALSWTPTSVAVTWGTRS